MAASASVRARGRHRRLALTHWQTAFAIALAVCLLVYVVGGLLGDVDASNPWGLSYGIAASLIMSGAALYAVRRRTMRLAVGKSRDWQQFHVYGGLLFMLLVLMHTGFRWPSSVMNWWLMLLSLFVTLSGAIGWFLQKWIPRILTSGLRSEVVYERIPELITELRGNAEKLADRGPDIIRDFYRKSLAKRMQKPRPRWEYFMDPSAEHQARIDEFEFLQEFLNSEDRARLRQLERIYRAKLEMDVHYTLQGCLRAWIVAHVPPSIALLVLVAVHIFNVWYY
jgi:hypothetical protein